MLYTNHLLVSNAIALPIMAQTNTLNVTNVLLLNLGVLLPDIDEPHSVIGQRTLGLSNVIKAVFGHRGLTHTIFFPLALFFISALITVKFDALTLSYCLAFGATLHILEDSFSRNGVYWLKPLSKFKYHIPLYTTGGAVEKTLGVCAILFIYYCYSQGKLTTTPDPLINPTNLSQWFAVFLSK
ncbi:metal-dependent hydrolase [Enterococcus bulliens]